MENAVSLHTGGVLIMEAVDLNGLSKTIQRHNSIQQVIPEVVDLNVGGVFHTTSLSTLQKYPDSMLAAMFSGRHHISTDCNGRFFIDRDGHLFKHILGFLRQGALPDLSVCLKVYQEAQFFNIQPMVDALELMRPVAGEKFKKIFLEHVPDYNANLHLMLNIAHQMATNHPERISKMNVCVYKQDRSLPQPLLSLEKSKDELRQNHRCDVSVTFGPWAASPDVYDLIDCIKHDLTEKGYELEHRCIGVCDKRVAEQHFCKRSIFEFKFKWW